MTLRERIAWLRAEAGADPRFAEMLDILDALEAQHRRTRAEQARLEERLARVENSSVFKTLRAVGHTASTTKGKLGQALLRSPLHPLFAKLKPVNPAAATEYTAWVQAEQASLLPAHVMTQQSRGWAYQPLISILMPVYRPHREWIEAAIQSVESQTYENWRLCLCCDGPVEPWLNDYLRSRAADNPRIRVAFASERCGIASALNGAATLADGDYVTFLDQDDVLPSYSLHFVVETMQAGAADVYYSDEDWMEPSGRRVRPNFKPGWSPELLAGCMYFGHLFVVRRDLMNDLGSFRDGFDGAQDYDLALRIVATGATVRHIPRILYHWRMHAGSTAAAAGAKPHAHMAGKRALQQAVQASGVEAAISDGSAPHTYSIQWRPATSAVSIVICSRTPKLLERCVESIRQTTRGINVQVIVVEHQSTETRQMAESLHCDVVSYGRMFNFSDMNNTGAAEARHDTLLFLNDDVTALKAGWLEALMALTERPDVAIAGAKLVYPSGAIQHAGIALGIGEATGHIGRGKFASDIWRWLDLRRNVSAVTGACLAIRKEVFAELNGFDTEFPINYNDADLCLRARSSGYEVIYDPAATLRHDECATRAAGTRLEERDEFWRRWADLLEKPDPYFTPFLEGEDLRLVWREIMP